MKSDAFQVGDKVVLAYAGAACMPTVPKLVPGAVYCVSATKSVTYKGSDVHERIALVGVRMDRRLNPRQDEYLPAERFFRVSVSPQWQDGEESR